MEDEPKTEETEQLPTRKDFYETVDTADGPKEFIKHPEDAEKLAYTEKIGKEALDITLETRERGLEIELTPEQKQNEEIMKGLLEKYPHAFNEAVDENVSEVLAAKPGNLAIWVWENGMFGKKNKAGYFNRVYKEGTQAFLVSKDGVWQVFNHRGTREAFVSQKSFNLADRQFHIHEQDEPIRMRDLPDQYCDYGGRNFRDLTKDELGVLKQVFSDIEELHNNDVFPADKEQLTAKNILDKL